MGVASAGENTAPQPHTLHKSKTGLESQKDALATDDPLFVPAPQTKKIRKTLGKIGFWQYCQYVP